MIDATKIDELLPQTQCRQCGYQSCEEYAKAIAAGELHNRCAAGGQEVIIRLSELLGREELKLNPECGVSVPPEVALIDEKKCIGCKLCIDACLTDAIIGSPKHLHVVDIDRCNGCCLCQLACPVDCIRMVRIDRAWTQELAHTSKKNFILRNERRSRIRAEEEELLKQRSLTTNKRDFIASLLRKKILNEPGKTS